MSNNNNQPQQNEDQRETKTFSFKVDKLFYEAMGKGEVFNQLKNQAYAYFGSTKWQIEERRQNNLHSPSIWEKRNN